MSSPLDSAHYIANNRDNYTTWIVGLAEEVIRLSALRCETCGGSGEDPETEDECGCIHRACEVCRGSGRALCRCGMECVVCHLHWEGTN